MRYCRYFLFLPFLFIQFFSITVLAQMKIGDNPATIDPASLLELESGTKGLLLPRLSTIQQNAIVSPPAGLVIYNTDSGCQCWYNGSTWKSLCNPQNGNFWKLNGNAGTSIGTHFLGTTDNQGFVFKTNDIEVMRLDSAGNLGVGTIIPSNKFEVSGSFNMYKDSMRIFQSDDAFASWGAPGIQFAGAKGYNYGSGSYINGIFRYPAAGDDAMGFIAGYIDDANPVQQSAFAADSIGTQMYYNSANNTGTSLNIDEDGASLLSYNIANSTLGGILLNDSSLIVSTANLFTNQYTEVDMGQSYYSLIIGNDVDARYYEEFKTDSLYGFGIDDGILGVGSAFTLQKDYMDLYLYSYDRNSELLIDSSLTYNTSNTALGRGVTFNVNDSAATIVPDYGPGTQPFNVGIGTTTPNATLHIQGSLSTNIRIVAATDSVFSNDYTVITRQGGSAITLNLPDPATCSGRMYQLLNYGSSQVTLNYNIYSSDTVSSNILDIADSTSGGFAVGNKITIQSDGTEWICIGVH